MEQFNSIPEAVKAYKKGEMIIVVDDEDRENEGDLIMVAEKITPEAVNFMSKEARGLICVALTEERAEKLKLNLMVRDNTALHQTRFTVSVDAKEGTTTGISAHDRSTTIKTIYNPETTPSQLARPGHIFPILAVKGGVLRRAGHTEASIDLAGFAKLDPTAVLCEIIDEDGTMAKLPRLIEMSEKFGLKLISVRDIIEYRRKNEKLVELVEKVKMPTSNGEFVLHLYENILSKETHVALVKGTVSKEKAVLVRVHSECLTGDALGSMRCDCGDQLDRALKNIEEEGNGILLYMRQEGRGIGLKNKILAYHQQDLGKDTVEANEALGLKPDLRDYGIGAQILVDLGVRKMKLMTNNPKKVVGLDAYGLEIIERVPLEVEPHVQNKKYLETKRDKLGHMILKG
ncbi:MAG: bifunctional 3,4-dihydroxy-2-butanone-4-phosphate synthase/GTP cyclohydrolase II [Candidatus Marinimicrobia bacterium]|nr:bifunctional 3,4-dihydroxy-2-butanone-4-phosphate synthase/GTP cyclohydrolase II [Candidatus Neomarinimicrobiota bacterium]